jgi:molybdenum cofactor biosynthesis enzyme MoaA
LKTCKNIESGVRFDFDGVHCCCANTWQSPAIVTAAEMASGGVDYDLVLERRRRLHDALNAGDPVAGDCLRCSRVFETDAANVDFSRLGVPDHSSGFNISHATFCNMRCGYCLYTQMDNFKPAAYGNDRIVEFIEQFRKRGKINPGTWIEYNGGEPTLLPGFEELLEYLLVNNIGQVCLFSNAIAFKQAVYDGLAANRMYLTVSIDAGTPETFAKVRGVPGSVLNRVAENLRRYQSSGTRNLWPKYIITADNKTDADLSGFVEMMRELRPSTVYVCPEFPYGDQEIPRSSVEFGAKLLRALREAGLGTYIQTDDMKGDPKLMRYSKDVRVA